MTGMSISSDPTCVSYCMTTELSPTLQDGHVCALCSIAGLLLYKIMFLYSRVPSTIKDGTHLAFTNMQGGQPELCPHPMPASRVDTLLCCICLSLRV